MTKIKPRKDNQNDSGADFYVSLNLKKKNRRK